MPAHLQLKHPLAVRLMHWLNFPLLVMMIWSGILIYWANPVYGLWIGSYEIVHFFPQWFYDALSIPYRLAEGLQLHFFFMWLYAVNGLAYVAYTVISGQWRALLPLPGSFLRAPVVALAELHVIKQAPPQGKYNDAQRIAYTLVILMGLGTIITGLAIHKPLQLAWLTRLLGGYEWARWQHFWLMVLLVAFSVVHVVQVILAGWANLRAMITGYELVDTRIEPKAAGESSAEAELG